MVRRFALIGAAGYVAPRHMKAIKQTSNELIAAFDPNDSVGVIDSYFPNAEFFVEFERFDRHLEKIRRARNSVSLDFLSVCSPNYLHDAHIRFGLRLGADVICEKPVVLNPWNIDALEAMEAESKGRVNTILQLRLHPSLIALRERVMRSNETFDVRLTYVTSRGNWYLRSWKGDIKKSGGIATNIGVHFFDLLHWLFGPSNASVVHFADDKTNAGRLDCERARIQWFLSTDDSCLPAAAKASGARTHRSIEINSEEIEFSEGFADLHTTSYQKILEGHGFSLRDCIPAIQTVSQIRKAQPIGLTGDYHPMLKQ